MKKTYKEKPFKTERDKQIKEAVEAYSKTPKPLNTKIRKPIGEEE